VFRFAREKISGSTNAENVCYGKDSKDVESNVNPHEPKVPPMMAIEDIRIRRQIFVRRPEWTKFATVHRVRIRDVSAEIIYKLTEVLLTRLT